MMCIINLKKKFTDLNDMGNFLDVTDNLLLK